MSVSKGEVLPIEKVCWAPRQREIETLEGNMSRENRLRVVSVSPCFKGSVSVSASDSTGSISL